MTKIMDGRVISASVAFVCISKLKSYNANVGYSAISHLNSTAKQCNRKSNEVIILSSMTGLILIAPDESADNFIKFLTRFVPKCFDSGLPIKIGITHGDIEELRDVDGGVNYIGTPLNHAARLVFSEKNKSCLADKSYRDFYDHIFGAANNPVFVFATKSIKVKGKTHDSNAFVCYEPNPGHLQVRKKLSWSNLPKIRTQMRQVAGIALAYDLPKFSAGDRSQLSKRFRSVIDMFQVCKNNGTIPAKSKLFFLPGGDGGIIVLTEAKRFVVPIVREFAELLEIESGDKDASINVESRIGAHYGVIFLYKNAANVLRPTGKTCFVADEIAGDSIARKNGGIVFSGSLIDALSLGSNKNFKEKFEPLPAIAKGAAKNVKRFIPRHTQTAKEHPLFEKLFGPRGSWEQL